MKPSRRAFAPRSPHSAWRACVAIGSLLAAQWASNPASAQEPSPPPPVPPPVAAVPPPPDATAPKLPLALNRPAPDLGVDQWLGGGEGKKPTIGKIVADGGNGTGGSGLDPAELEAELAKGLENLDRALGEIGGRRPPGKLASHHGRVVLIHVLDWAAPSASSSLLQLVRDVVRANADRGVTAITIMEPGVNAESRARAEGIEWPVAMTPLRAGPCPYVAEPATCEAFVVGRSGELAWRGNAVADRKGFLRAVASACGRIATERIEHDLGELGPALAEYYAGNLGKAEVLVSRAHAESLRTGQVARLQDAERLMRKLSDTELSWLRAMRDAAKRRQDFDRYVVHVDALARALPRTSGKEAVAHEKETAKKVENAVRLADERAWLVCQGQRPPLFPAHRDREGDNFANRLEKLLNDARSPEVKARAQDLLDRYRTAAK